MYLLYDGSCKFCTAGSERLARMCAPGTVVRVSNKDEAGMARLPEAARAGIGGALQLVSPDGEVAAGAEAVNRALHTRGVWRLVTWAYWLPGVRQVCDRMYGQVAKRRYRIMGKVEGAGGCDTGSCVRPG
jgi:predicted DCC family thiol-disulfide oxidoreductase YuxK